jgi:hypothetical protein
MKKINDQLEEQYKHLSQDEKEKIKDLENIIKSGNIHTIPTYGSWLPTESIGEFRARIKSEQKSNIEQPKPIVANNEHVVTETQSTLALRKFMAFEIPGILRDKLDKQRFKFVFLRNDVTSWWDLRSDVFTQLKTAFPFIHDVNIEHSTIYMYDDKYEDPYVTITYDDHDYLDKSKLQEIQELIGNHISRTELKEDGSLIFYQSKRKDFIFKTLDELPPGRREMILSNNSNREVDFN